MRTVRLYRTDGGTSLTFRISKAAENRFAAASELRNQLAQLSVLEVCSDIDEKWQRLSAAAQQEKKIGIMRGVPAEGQARDRDEFQLLKLWRQGNEAGIRKMFAARRRLPKYDKELSNVLRLYWWGEEDGFGLNWFSFTALAVVLKAWGFHLQSASALARQCQRLGLVSLLKRSVANKNQVVVAGRSVTIR